MTDSGANLICAYCGAHDKRYLGVCSVCHHTVCENCGSVQICQGKRHVTHKGCLRKHEGGFKMIKFVD